MSSQRETIITIKPRNGFTVLPNRTLRDNRLSLKTRAILAIMFSLPEDWDYTVAGLSTICWSLSHARMAACLSSPRG